jgi:hypothetical protein
VPGMFGLSESSVRMTEFVPDSQNTATSIWVSKAFEEGVKAIPIKLNAPGSRLLSVPYMPEPP